MEFRFESKFYNYESKIIFEKIFQNKNHVNEFFIWGEERSRIRKINNFWFLQKSFMEFCFGPKYVYHRSKIIFDS